MTDDEIWTFAYKFTHNPDLHDELTVLIKLLQSVSVSDITGIECEDVDGKNWFDLRSKLLESNTRETQ